MASSDGRIAGGAAGQEARVRAEALLGRSLLDRYRLEEVIAFGGIAAVFRAKRTATGEDVAIKILHPDVEDLPELIQRFKREAIAGRHIYHPNVAAVYEIAQLDDGSWFMVMEFIRGITLRNLIDQGPLAPLRAARIARQIAEALNAAHDLGIVHRDVKPLNIMILSGPEERVQLIDFGLAKVPVEELALGNENGRRSITQAGVIFGTMAYMAPEAALGMRAIDKRADLYALGVVLYEMLAGKHPFTATTPAALFAQHRSATLPSIAERAPEITVPVALEAVVKRLLEKDPDNRFPHARAVIVALDTAIQQIETSELRGSFVRPAHLPRIFVFLAFGGGAVLVVVLVWLLLRAEVIFVR